jgi:hypothetical protein
MDRMTSHTLAMSGCRDPLGGKIYRCDSGTGGRSSKEVNHDGVDTAASAATRA